LAIFKVPSGFNIQTGAITTDNANVFGDLAFPIITFVWLFAIAAGVLVALATFANVNLPERVLDFTWAQLHLAAAGFCAIVMVFWFITSDQPDKGIGFWLLLLGSIALVVGAVMRLKESPSPAGGSTPPTAF
jgi:predicted membrane channel-forming protein YqfA (hemolysin III family)